MKQSFVKTTAKKFVTAAFISASLLFASSGVKAATGNLAIIEILSTDKPSIQFAGSTSDALLFKVHLINDKADNFTVTIKNNDGALLFSKTFNDVDFNKQFKILKSDDTNNSYYFTISSSNKNLEETYVISSTLKTVNDVTINRL
jgi:hypothetical protein